MNNKMIFLNDFYEYGSCNSPHMIECCEKSPYENMDKTIEYLETKGHTTCVSTGKAIDRITKEPIHGLYSLESKTDGCFIWCNDLAYHIKKYNLRLSKEFEKHINNVDLACKTIILFNINRSDNIISCNYSPDYSGYYGYLKLDIESEQFSEMKITPIMPDRYKALFEVKKTLLTLLSKEHIPDYFLLKYN